MSPGCVRETSEGRDAVQIHDGQLSEPDSVTRIGRPVRGSVERNTTESPGWGKSAGTVGSPTKAITRATTDFGTMFPAPNPPINPSNLPAPRRLLIQSRPNP